MQSETKAEQPCRVCGGTITVHDFSEYRGDPMHLILGPGSAGQMTRSRAIYCTVCGVSYHHLPSPPSKET